MKPNRFTSFQWAKIIKASKDPILNLCLVFKAVGLRTAPE
jgi:hypothetical protein